MPTNEQHLHLVLAACQAKRDVDTRIFLRLAMVAFFFGTGCAFAMFLIGACLSVI